RPMLQYSEVLSYVALGEFDILKHLQHNILTKPWTMTSLRSTHRGMAIKYFKILQAHDTIGTRNMHKLILN
ncbi:hypothetical protein F4604DRAFT_1570194, partial [Suillus subluteus]